MTEHDNTADQCSCCNGTVTSDELVARYREMIDKHGFGVVGVFSDEEPCWYYTVGLQETLGHPELMLYGLEPSLAQNILWDAVTKIKGGERLEPGTVVDDIIRNYGMAIVKVDEPLDPRYPLNMCTFFTDMDKIAAVQLVWPNVNGVFPWQPGGQQEQAVLGTWSA